MSGISLLVMAVAAGISVGVLQNSLVVSEDSLATLSNLITSSQLFGWTLFGWLVIFSADLIVAWGLFKFFANINSSISFWAGLIRAIYTLILGVAVYQLITVWQILNSSHQDAQVVMDLIRLFEHIWSLGLIVFGFHLVGIGYLSLKSNTVPRWIGILLYGAGVCYSLIHASKAIFPEEIELIASIEVALASPMALAELGLAVWLIRKGGRDTQLLK